MSNPVRAPRKPEPDFVLSIPPLGPFADSDIRVELYQFDHEHSSILFDLRIDGQIEHTARNCTFDPHLDDLRTGDLAEHARAYLRYHANDGLVLSDGETDQVEAWLSSVTESA